MMPRSGRARDARRAHADRSAHGWQAGADLVKVFPCDSAGGAQHVRALKGDMAGPGMVKLTFSRAASRVLRLAVNPAVGRVFVEGELALIPGHCP